MEGIWDRDKGLLGFIYAVLTIAHVAARLLVEAAVFIENLRSGVVVPGKGPAQLSRAWTARMGSHKGASFFPAGSLYDEKDPTFLGSTDDGRHLEVSSARGETRRRATRREEFLQGEGSKR